MVLRFYVLVVRRESAGTIRVVHQKLRASIPILVAALAVAAIVYWQSPPASKVKIGEMAPDLVLPSHGGADTRLSDLRGRVVLLVTFSAECDDCAQQLLSIENLHRIYRPYGLAVIGISLDHDKKAEDAFLQRSNVSFIVLDDPSARRFAPVFGGVQPPQCYWIDVSGHLVAIDRGPVDWKARETIARLRGLLQQTGREVP
jgi:peroxiredoxin